MEKPKGITRIEVVVIVAVGLAFCIILFLLATRRNGGHPWYTYCPGNLRDLSLAWLMYADENDGKIVNGMAGVDREKDGIVVEKAWIGKDWADDYKQGGVLDPNKQEEAIRAGALWPYVKNVRSYRCPPGGQMRTSSIVDSMNGVPQPGNPMGRGPMEVMDKLIAKNRSQVRSPDTRAVFICVGWAAPGSYAVYYNKDKWWDPPPLPHLMGTTVSFADFHVERWKWKGEETVRLGESAGPKQLSKHVSPTTSKGKEDLHKLQKAVWGKLGYEP